MRSVMSSHFIRGSRRISLEDKTLKSRVGVFFSRDQGRIGDDHHRAKTSEVPFDGL